MKKILIVVFIAVLSVLAVSCDFNDEGETETGNFWAQNTSTEKFYRVDAELLASNARCEVWVEKGQGVSVATAQAVAYEYQQIIEPSLLSVFNLTTQEGHNIMKVADFYGNNDNKLCILLLDIKDDYKKDVNDSYVAGYFYSVDFYDEKTAAQRGYKTNERDMIYIDVKPGLENEAKIDEAYMTLAHELQHLMNYATTQLLYQNNKRDYLMDLWIDEGLSSAAEVIYSKKQNLGRIAWYHNNGIYDGDAKKNIVTSSIHFGNNFFVWNNVMCNKHGNGNAGCNNACLAANKNNYAILDEYATVYLFFQWLKIQYGESVYNQIMTSPHHDYQAVVNASNVNKSNWKELIQTWHAANFIYSSSGEFGYKNAFNDILQDSNYELPKHYAPGSNGSYNINLLPGEGVLSLANAQENGSGNNIVFLYLSNTSSSPTFASGTTMLTFNSSSDNTSGKLSGKVTGNAPSSINVNTNIITQNSRFAVSASSSIGPFRIGAHDVLSRQGSLLDGSSAPLLLKVSDDEQN